MEQSEPLNLSVRVEVAKVTIPVSNDTGLINNSFNGENLLPVNESSEKVRDHDMKNSVAIIPVRRNPPRRIKIPKKYENFFTKDPRRPGEEIKNAHVGLDATVVTSEDSEDGVEQNKENLEQGESFKDLIPTINNNMSSLKKFAVDVATRNRSIRRRKNPVAEKRLIAGKALVSEIRSMVMTQSKLTSIVTQIETAGSSKK